MAKRAIYGTTVANTVLTLALEDDFALVDVISRDGTAELFVRTDGVDPTVAGDESDYIAAAPGAYATMAAPGKTTQVRIISPGVVKVAVIGKQQ